MIQKTIEKTPPVPVPARKKGWWTTIQMVRDVLVLNIYQNKILKARHCINVKTKEHMTLRTEYGTAWSTEKVERAYNFPVYDFYYMSSRVQEEINIRCRMSAEDAKLITEKIEISEYCRAETPMERISRAELEYGQEKRRTYEENRVSRVNQMMDRLPVIPPGIHKWIDQRVTGLQDYCLKDQNTKQWSCSSCGKSFKETKIHRAEGSGRARDKDMVICPVCGKSIRIQKRRKRVEILTHFAMVQPVDDEISVVRHFAADICCLPGKKKEIDIVESVRIVMFKDPNRKKNCDLYYGQYYRLDGITEGIKNHQYFDNKSNPAGKRICEGYLYNGGIEEAFRGTAYEEWTRLFMEFAAAGLKLNYNGMMCCRDQRYIALMEMLYRGRFYKLLNEESQNVDPWHKDYYGEMNLSGSGMEEVFKLYDRQKINRIREKNGGRRMLNWMQYSEETGEKISDVTLNWLLKNNLSVADMRKSVTQMTVEQAMNYLNRQQRESYTGKSIRVVINQYEDYIGMCKRLKKNLSDEMVYRPRELKRRHNEAVAEAERRSAQHRAAEYSEKFGAAEKVLKSIREKLEYTGEEFFIKVPEKIVDIVAEGNYLHHCAGATDRYFDRIKQHETYICFLRKITEPDIPFYTIEVEPGGTIRQHRGMYDEEPELEKVKPFLREWQAVIRKRMSKKDHKRAAESKIKREENIEELKAKNNTRVLNGLMEDLMEVI